MSSHLPTLFLKDNFDQAQAMVKVVRKLLDESDASLVQVFSNLHPSNAALIIQFLASSERDDLIDLLGNDFNPEILSYLDESVREDLIDSWAVHEIAQKIELLDGQDAIKILEELNKEERHALLRALKPQVRVFLEEGLAYPEDSAGRIMQNQVVAVPKEWTIGQVRSFLMNASSLPDDIFEIFVVDKDRRPMSRININRLFKASDSSSLDLVCEPIEVVLSATVDQKDVTYAFRQYDLISAPVVDKKDKLIGVITSVDIVGIIYSEAQEEFLHSAALDESDFYENWWGTSKSRIRWLSVSLVTSTFIALVIDIFQEMLAQRAELVSLISVVMSLSGVAGIQVVTVIMRAIMNRELGAVNAKRVLLKEAFVAVLNGVILGSVFGSFVAYKNSDFRFIPLIMLALAAGMLWSAFAGTIFPIALNRIGIDPALSVGVFLSATIDAFAALSFLFLSYWMFFG